MDETDERLLSAFHDGELPPELLRRVTGRLVENPESSRYLQDMTRLSAELKQVSFPGLTAAGWDRLHRRWDRSWDRGLVRLGWGLSGLAAAVLLAGSVTLLSDRRGGPEASVPPWVETQASVEASAREAATPAAAWYLADARGGNDFGQ